VSEKISGPGRPRRRLIVALTAAATAAVVSAALVLPGRHERQVAEHGEGLEPMTEADVAAVKAAVEMQTGRPVYYVWRDRQGAVEAFTGGEHRGRNGYRVEKTGEGWKVVGSFYAFWA
jgi:hypothetical protein